MIIFATQFIFNRLMAKNTSIIIKGARVNNLKNIDVEIPRNSPVPASPRSHSIHSMPRGNGAMWKASAVTPASFWDV